MKHEFVKSTWKTREALQKIIQARESDGCSVVALGDLFGGDVLVFCNDGNRYEHQVLSVFFKTPDQAAKLVEDREVEGWQTCAIGDCFGSTLLILKRRI